MYFVHFKDAFTMSEYGQECSRLYKSSKLSAPRYVTHSVGSHLPNTHYHNLKFQIETRNIKVFVSIVEQ